MGDNDFIKENIVGRQDSWKKSARHYGRIALSAVLFGILSAGTFAMVEPVIGSHLKKDEPETVHFETEPETQEAETRTETVAPETEKETEAPEETVPVEDIVRDEIRSYEYSIEDYRRMNSVLKKIATSADHSIAEVRSRVRSSDLFGQVERPGNSSTGVVIARTSGEVLILTSDSVIKEAGNIEVVFYGDRNYPASVKAVDEVDGIAVVSVPMSSLTYRDGQEVRTISLGDSNMLQRGDIVIAVGAPAGTYMSSTVGSIASVSFNKLYADGNIKDMIADIDIDPAYGSFIIDTDGELVGWVLPDSEGSSHGYERIVGISDFLDVIETMSNGTEYAYLGLKVQEMTQDMSKAGLPDGLYISECIQNSPAYNAGIQNGDVLVGINETEIRNMSDYRTVLKELQTGDEADVTVMRQNGAEYATVHFSVTIAGR
ncbi:serine protease, S1-C subfamily, contains C-terminal PDZ domain [Oribacterium sp. WCC10]|nr:serine protease, S1-C subfamily, contains C-terminal PDZ domain [Oribacterium sp. WCC10]